MARHFGCPKVQVRRKTNTNKRNIEAKSWSGIDAFSPLGKCRVEGQIVGSAFPRLQKKVWSKENPARMRSDEMTVRKEARFASPWEIYSWVIINPSQLAFFATVQTASGDHHEQGHAGTSVSEVTQTSPTTTTYAARSAGDNIIAH
jgi:hypothetical protein